MGRFYDGDIQGKFWFGIQDSNDVEELVTITCNTYFSWLVCHCVAEIDEDYCKQCYDSKEEHIEAAIEEESYEDECLYYEEGTQGYSLDKSTHYEELLTNMNNLKKEIPEGIIKFFENIEQNDKILDAFTGVFNDINKYIDEKPKDSKEYNKLLVLIARYMLGFQIEYCLRTTDSCNIICEY